MTSRKPLLRASSDEQLADCCMRPAGTIREAIARIDRNQRGIVLVTDENGRFVNTITDGDVRRAMLSGQGLDTPVSVLLLRKGASPYPSPVTAAIGTDHASLLQLMKDRGVRQVPIVDDGGLITGLVTLEEFLPDQALPLQAVIMAGGFGTRLRPLTEELPKPMLPVGDRPLMQHIVEQLREAGIRRMNVTTHFMPEKIVDHFGDGAAFGVELSYVNEDTPLGTAGALGLIARTSEPLLVVNGDILTDVDFRAMLSFHREHKADMTVAVRRFDLQVPYGVLDTEGVVVRRITEKPLLHFTVNAGIYLLEPEVHQWIPANERFNMTDLMQRLIDADRTVATFPVREYWLDIGRHGDYEQAQEDMRIRQDPR